MSRKSLAEFHSTRPHYAEQGQAVACAVHAARCEMQPETHACYYVSYYTGGFVA
jgi:hypothetical protein